MKKSIYLFLFILTALFTLNPQVKNNNTKGIMNANKIRQTRDLKQDDAYKDSKRWAIVIGINNYEDQFIADLSKAQNDAKVMADVLKHEGQFDFVFLFSDDTFRESESYPSLNNIVARMEFLKDEIKPNDTVIFTFSGHGIADDDGRSYLLTADTVITQPYKTSLPVYEIEDWIKALKVKKNIVMLDACRNIVEKTKGINIKTIMEEKNSQAEISAIVYATSPGEFSYEHESEPYGVFTSYVIEGLKGKADKDNDVMITFNELRSYVESSVRQWAIQHNKKQKPYTSIKGEFTGDLVLSVIPLVERSKFKPNTLQTSYTLQLNLYKAMNISSLSLIITAIAGSAVSGIIGGVGYMQYYNLQPGALLEDYRLYWNMKDYGLWCAIGFGSLALSAIIPFAVSFAINPRNKNKKISLLVDFNINNETIVLGAGFRFN